jgi:hypothetical protein
MSRGEGRIRESSETAISRVRADPAKSAALGLAAFVLAGVALFATRSAFAASPPALVNYQGVLRDAADKPRNGTFDMTFHFFDAVTAGNEILVDAHTGGGGVVVTGGLFNVALGSGTLSDGSGPGTYATLDQVFRDFSAVWMEVQVGAETLSPRIRVQAEPYALNASNLQGKPAAGFIDTSSGAQTKAGHLVGNGGVEGNDSSLSGVGVQGMGGSAGGVFADSSIATVSHLGYNYFDGISHYYYGVHGSGTTAGGWFQNPSTGSSALVAYGSTGGYFTGSAGDYAEAGLPGYGIIASGSTTGVYATGSLGLFGSGVQGVSGYGSSKGGSFANSSNSVDLATGSYGVYSTGSFTGGFFGNTTGDGQAFAGNGNYGLYAYGSVAGAYLYDTNNSGTAWVAYGDLGIDGRGAQAGGHFAKPFTNAQSYLAASNGLTENGVYGLSNGSLESPGYFLDQYAGSYAYTGQGGYKIWGSGSVSFVQNDPGDSSRIIQYTAPEGDETAVYTRGSARLENGVARVTLGGTFASVANPDFGLTAQLTPRGSAVPLAVESVSTSELVVRGPAGGPPDLAFDYAVWGLRIGFEDRPVLRPKMQEAFIPSMEGDETLYAAHPDLKEFNARARFEGMEKRVHPEQAATKSRAASDKLRTAIHVYDRRTDLQKLAASVPPTGEAPPQARGSSSARAAENPSPIPGGTAPASPGESSPKIEPHDASVTASAAPQPVRPAPLEGPEPLLFTASGEVEPGDLLALDPGRPGRLVRAAGSTDGRDVVGVAALVLPDGEERPPKVVLADGRIARVKANAGSGAIQPGDSVAASPTPGQVGRSDGGSSQPILGKALDGLDAGTGMIRVLLYR